MSKVDARVWAGIDVLFDDYARLQPQDQVVVAYTPESRESAAWIATALKLRGKQARLVGMQPIKDETFEQRLSAALPPPESLTNGSKLVLFTVERDTMSHVKHFRGALARYGREQWIAVRIINASEEFFTKSFNVRSAELSAVNTALFERFMKARELRVKSSSGTDLRIQIDSDKFRWISNRGVWRPGSFVILPAGEIATFPAAIEGVLVADGAFNVNAYTSVDARLGKNPIRVRIKDSQAVDFECNSPEVTRLLEAVFAVPNARRVGELGFGTNAGMGEFVSMNSHLNERHPGVHIGFGQHNQSIYAMEYDCPIHMDMIASDGLVWVDGEQEPVNLQKVTPSTGQHPTLVLDEDIDGDCCGVWVDDQLLQACPIIPPEKVKALRAQQQQAQGQ